MWFKILYNLNIISITIKLIKIFVVTKSIIFNRISYYPKSVTLFENKFASYINKKYGLTFCNGTSSIEAALFALDIGVGDEVIVPSFTFHASIDPIKNCGATPVFVDIDLESGCIDINSLDSLISEKTKCLIVVYIFGQTPILDQIVNKCQSHGIKIIEDVSHAHGGEYNGQKLGSFGDISCFSLQGAKAVAAGEGGIALTDNHHFFIRMSMYGHFTRHSKYFIEDFKYTGLGHKMRAHPLGIGLAAVDLKYLNYFNSLCFKNESKIKEIFKFNQEIDFFSVNHYNVKGGFFGGLPMRVNLDKVSLDFVHELFTVNGIHVSKSPFVEHHKLNIYSSKKDISLLNTEHLSKCLLLIDRRYLIYLPFFIKYKLRKISKELKNA